MKSSLTLFLFAAIISLCASTTLTSCKTTENPSPHTKKVRDQNFHSDIMRRHNRRDRH